MFEIADFFRAWASVELLSLVGLGTFLGIYIGAIPGLSVTMAVSILISFTFSWDVNEAMCLMIGVYMGGAYGGSRPAILLNIPGAPSAIATALDGYPLALKGEAGRAIGLSTVVSVLGGFFGIFILVIAAPIVSKFALSFHPRDYMLLGLLGLFLLATLSGNSPSKSFFVGALGLLVGAVGLDPLSGEERFTFGQTQLWNGISPISVMIGVFGVSGALVQLEYLNAEQVRQKLDKILPSFADVIKYLPLSLRSSFIGVIVGALPGTGGDIASLIAYDQAKRTTKNPEVEFGSGAKEGLVAPESANNAAVGGAFIPMLTLGIPGDAVTAVFIGALYIHGLNPGPLLIDSNPGIFGFIVGALTLANIFLLIFGLTGIKVFSRLVETPKGVLIPIILLLSVVGAFSINNSMADVWWMIGFGISGYFLQKFGYHPGPLVLGVILSRLIDENWRRAIIYERDDFSSFLSSMLSSPLSLILIAVMAISLVGSSKGLRNFPKAIAIRARQFLSR